MRAWRLVPLAFLTLAAACAGIILALPPRDSVWAQALPTDTGLPPLDAVSQAYITNTFEEAINVRVGPSTTVYPIPCGSLPVGASAVALGATPAREWVQIEFPDCPGGIGWVYAANVTLTGSLRIVESPPTPIPLATATIDPTLAAAFQAEPTSTRLPTFTPPPPLIAPTFSEVPRPGGGFPMGAAIIAAVFLGALVLVVSSVGRR